MFCNHCGAQIEDDSLFCTNCGAKQVKEQAPQNVNTQQPEEPVVINSYAPPVQQPVYPVGGSQNSQNNYQENTAQATLASPMKASFMEAVKLYFINYTNFTGRSTVTEYWWAFLFNYLASFVLSLIPVIGSVLALGLVIPGIAISVRRLHDTGKAWTYLLMGLIPIAGAIILIIRFCKPSDADNQWGPAPRN